MQGTVILPKLENGCLSVACFFLHPRDGGAKVFHKPIKNTHVGYTCGRTIWAWLTVSTADLVVRCGKDTILAEGCGGAGTGSRARGHAGIDEEGDEEVR